MAKILAQQGSWVFMVEAGTGDFEGKTGIAMARVYDRRQATLSDPWPVEALLARGYWDDVSESEDRQRLLADEIAHIA